MKGEWILSNIGRNEKPIHSYLLPMNWLCPRLYRLNFRSTTSIYAYLNSVPWGGYCIWTYFSRDASRYYQKEKTFESQARPTFILTFDKCHCDKRHSSWTNWLTINVGKKLVDWEVCWVAYWCENARKHMSRWNGRRDMTERLLKTTLSSQ